MGSWLLHLSCSRQLEKRFHPTHRLQRLRQRVLLQLLDGEVDAASSGVHVQDLHGNLVTYGGMKEKENKLMAATIKHVQNLHGNLVTYRGMKEKENKLLAALCLMVTTKQLSLVLCSEFTSITFIDRRQNDTATLRAVPYKIVAQSQAASTF